MEFAGVTRIRNPKTLRKWIKNGKHKQLIDAGFTFSVGCGRYRAERCECSKCRRSVNSPLQKILDEYEA